MTNEVEATPVAPEASVGVGDLITAREAASRLGLSIVSIRAAFREGRLRGSRIENGDTRWSVLLIEPASVEEYRARYLRRR